MEIANRHILVTGASRGIGRAFANMCAEDKAYLHVVVRKEDDELQKELENAGAKSVTQWVVDLSSRESIEQLVQQLKDVQIDILFNNAGTLTGGLLEEQPLDEIYNMLQVNLNAIVHLTRGLLPGMLARRRGKIINNSSISAYMHFPGVSTYAASKAAVAAFTDCLRVELKDTGVSTLLLLTPAVKTGLYQEFERLHGPSLPVLNEVISPLKYVQMIREAILHDLELLEPVGLAGVGLKVAKYIKPLFDFGVAHRFKR
ncbi:MAG: SDR family NAD(P)-dependent oxidoreductase [Bacillota bacterium]